MYTHKTFFSRLRPRLPSEPACRQYSIDKGPSLSQGYLVTHSHHPSPAQLLLQSIRERSRRTRPVGVREIDGGEERSERGNEAADQEEGLARGGMGVLLEGEDAEDVVVLMDGLAVVAALLLVPPVGVRVAELTLLARRVNVAAVLWKKSRTISF